MKFDIHVHLHGLEPLLAQGNRIMAILDDLKAEVAQVKTVEASAAVLLDGIHQKLVEALASGNPNEIQNIIDGLEASRNDLAAAVIRNTDAPPAPAAPADQPTA